MQHIVIQPGELTLAQLRDVHRQHIPISLSPDAFEAIHAAEKVVLGVIAENRTVYGINTGFGLLANTKIDVSELELLQRSIVLSHAAGIGNTSEARERLWRVRPLTATERARDRRRSESRVEHACLDGCDGCRLAGRQRKAAAGCCRRRSAGQEWDCCV